VIYLHSVSSAEEKPYDHKYKAREMLLDFRKS